MWTLAGSVLRPSTVRCVKQTLMLIALPTARMQTANSVRKADAVVKRALVLAKAAIDHSMARVSSAAADKVSVLPAAEVDASRETLVPSGHPPARHLFMIIEQEVDRDSQLIR